MQEPVSGDDRDVMRARHSVGLKEARKHTPVTSHGPTIPSIQPSLILNFQDAFRTGKALENGWITGLPGTIYNRFIDADFILILCEIPLLLISK